MGRRGECERGVVFRWVVVGGRGVRVITISLVTVNPHDPVLTLVLRPPPLTERGLVTT